ncbi:MAG: hypothetical protein HFJ04_05775 [Lachnospiraceae bacterium]|nr:hypothetical protein [Lachnospiraceae bacterium]
MKTLHIHIGTPKTGTTALQNFCGENRSVLEAKGYCYPKFSFIYQGIPMVRNAHFLTAPIFDEHGKRSKEKETQRFLDGIKEICRLFERVDHVVISDESIWKCMDSSRKTLWKDLKAEAEQAGFKIHVIVYLRRQDDFLGSLYNQRIKDGKVSLYKSSFEEFTDKLDLQIRMEYYTKLERIADIIGKESITVRRYEMESYQGGNIYSDFLFSLGLSLTEEYKISQGIRNIGLYGNTLEMKRILNSLPQLEDQEAQNFMMQMLMRFSEVSKKAYPCQMFSKEEAKAFLEQYNSDNRRIAEEYLKEPGKELFHSTDKDLPKWEKDNPYMLDDVIRFIGVTGIYLFQENLSLKQKLNSMEKEFRSLKYKIRHPVRSAFGFAKRKLRQNAAKE